MKTRDKAVGIRDMTLGFSDSFGSFALLLPSLLLKTPSPNSLLCRSYNLKNEFLQTFHPALIDVVISLTCAHNNTPLKVICSHSAIFNL